MRTIYTTAAYWSWVVLFLVWLPGYFLRKPVARRPHRGRQLATSTKALIPFVW